MRVDIHIPGSPETPVEWINLQIVNDLPGPICIYIYITNGTPRFQNNPFNQKSQEIKKLL